MKISETSQRVALSAALLAAVAWAGAEVAADETPTAEQPGAKELYLPPQIMRVPENNDYRDPGSDYCFDRMVQGPNVAIFWHKEYGDDPLKQSDRRKRFDVNLMLSECERFYDFYVCELKKEFYGKLSRATQRGEDVVTTYKRLAGADQRAFNDEMFDAARRFITWDLARVADVAQRYANQHHTRLQHLGDGWLRIATERTPQDYGYNGIRLVPPAAESEVRVDFRGLAGLGGAEDAPAELGAQAGWRYGFVAQKTDGSRVYSEVGREPHGSATFAVPADAEHLWLVVMGAPTEHVPLPGGRRRRQAEAPPERQWPYQFQLKGAEVHPSYLE